MINFILDDLEVDEKSRDEWTKNHKVKVQYQAMKEAEKKAKREAMAQVMLQALKRIKEKK